jgi:hypothetical protein
MRPNPAATHTEQEPQPIRDVLDELLSRLALSTDPLVAEWAGGLLDGDKAEQTTPAANANAKEKTRGRRKSR